jgi:prepilin-type N-terminal cleavage/methylation domain-containing protein
MEARVERTGIPQPRENERGFNLIEVIVAMGLLGTVLVAIMTLFFWGRQHVYAGRQLTKANALGTRVLEDMSPLTKQDIYNGLFAIDDTAAGTSVTIAGVTYANARIRSTNATLIASPPSDIQTQKSGGPDLLGKWTTQLGSNLQDGSVTLIMQPKIDPANASPNETFGGSQLLQLRVLVMWREAKRNRSLEIDSVKAF